MPHPLTLPGLESKEADRSAITLRDHVNATLKDEGNQYVKDKDGWTNKNFLWLLVEDYGLDKLRAQVKRPLNGLRIVLIDFVGWRRAVAGELDRHVTGEVHRVAVAARGTRSHVVAESIDGPTHG